MAVRGVMTQLYFTDPITYEQKYDMQNYFVNGREIFPGVLSEYNNFRVSSIDVNRTTVKQKFTVTFSGVAKNIDLVEESILNNYIVGYFIWRWSSTEGLDNPSAFNLFADCLASAEEGSSDFSTVKLQCSTYSKTVNADFPGRKIPWQILTPLSLRKT